MKKYNLLKTIGIFFLVLVLLSWLIPVGTFSGSEFTEGTTVPVGLFDLFRVPLIAVGTFIQYALVFLAIGGFYGVLNKTGVFVPFVDGVTKKFKGKEKLFLTIVIVLFSLLSSLSGLPIPLFILVPFVVAVILNMGLSKLTALAATVGAILVGMIGSTYGFNVVGCINYFLSLEIHNQIITKIILLVMLTFLLVMFVTGKVNVELKQGKKVEKKDTKKGNKKSDKKDEVITSNEKIEIPFYESKGNNKKSPVPMIIIGTLVVVLALVSMYNWYYGLEVTFFQELYTSLMEIQIGTYPIVSNILGGVSQFGYWGYYELTVILMISSLLIGWIYSVKFNDVLEGFIEGSKKMLGVAFYATICGVLFTVLLSSQSGTIYNTILNFFLQMAESLNVFAASIAAFIGGFFYNDFYYLLSTSAGALSGKFDAVTLPVVGLVFQTMYGLSMLVFPTSIALIAGLKYLEVSYKEWLKYIWRFLLSILVIILIVLIIAVLFI